MEFNTLYRPEPSGYMPLRREAGAGGSGDDIERPLTPGIIKVSDIGQTVTEGARFGTLIQSAQGAMRMGTGKIELQTQMGGGAEAVGAEAYGKESRQAIREMGKAAQVEFTSVHAPTQVGNLSGFNAQQGFSDEQRKMSLDEVKKAISFCADTAGGGAVVIHTGEYQRAISEMEWAYERNKDGTIKKDKDGNPVYKFMGYQEEPGRAHTYMVDDRTGRIISDVRKSQVIREPVYWVAESDNSKGVDVDGRPRHIRKGDLVDMDGKYIDPTNREHLFKRVPKWNPELKRFDTRLLTWDDIEQKQAAYNSEAPPDKRLTAEEMAYRIQAETQMLQYRGSSLYHAQRYEQQVQARDELKKALIYWQSVEQNITDPEREWELMRQDPTIKHNAHVGGQFIPDKFKKATELIKDSLDQIEMEMRYTHESSASADAQADGVQDNLDHTKPLDKYALEQSMKSYAEAGIFAWQETKSNPYVKKDIFVAPENIFPEMGYGSHPEELIGLVKGAREAMVNAMTSPTIEDPYMRRDAHGNLKQVTNPDYVKGMTKEDAEKIAEKHIKATLDTQHMGMWRKHFMPKPGETKAETDKRFNEWYLDEIKHLEKEKVIGHMHIVDSMGGGHHHLPLGQGNLPLVDAITYLKKKGYAGTMVSEAFGEEQMGAGRIMTQTWKALGSPVYSIDMRGGPRWSEFNNAYFGKAEPPYFVFGAYAPSNEYTLWSNVPLE